MIWLHHVAHDFDATRHFLVVQIHPGNWFGNIVAGVVVYIFIDVCWQLFAKKLVKEGIAKVHREEIARHHREVVAPLLKQQHAARMRQGREQHRAVIKLAKEHHVAHMAALQSKETP